jgi:hypothetical protein
MPKVKAQLHFLLAVLTAFPAAAEAKKGPALYPSTPIVIDPVTVTGTSETVGQQQLFGAQPAHYRSAITVDKRVEAPEKLRSPGISPGDMLIEATPNGRAFAGKLYCRVDRINPKAVLTLCLGDADGDGKLETLYAGPGGILTPMLPYPVVRSVATIEPMAPVAFADSSKLQASIGFYVSGNNPLLGEHHFYPAFAQGEPRYTFEDQHKAAGVKTLPQLIRFQDAEVRMTAYADKKYTVSVTKPFPAGTIQLSVALPKQTIYVYVP